MITLEGLHNENIILYKVIAKQDKKLDKIKEIINSINFFDISYKEMYDILSEIYKIMEEK